MGEFVISNRESVGNKTIGAGQPGQGVNKEKNVHPARRKGKTKPHEDHPNC